MNYIMKIVKLLLALIVILPITVFSQETDNSNSTSQITSSSIWNPDMKTMNILSHDCAGVQPSRLGDCLNSVMQKTGADENAILFTSLVGGRSYMRSFRTTGMIDIAYTFDPFLKDDNMGIYLVNGNPQIINVDDFSILDLKALHSNNDFNSLAKRFPKISIFPADRGDKNTPIVKKFKNGSENFLVNYRLKDGCSKCQLLGFVTFQFDFDSTGKFTGTKLLQVNKTVSEDIPTVNKGIQGRIFINPNQLIKVNKGEDFIISLQSNRSSGYRWQISGDVDESVIKLLGNDYVEPFEHLPGKAGKVLFRFKAVGSGQTSVKLKYSRSWDAGHKAAEEVTFNVSVY